MNINNQNSLSHAIIHDQATSNQNNNLNHQNDSNMILQNIKKDIQYGIEIIQSNIEHGIEMIQGNIEHDLRGNLTTLEKVTQLLNHPLMAEHNITKINELNLGNNSGYTAVCNNQAIFTIGTTVSDTRLPTEFTSGDNFFITLSPGFNKLYNQLYAHDYEVIDYPEMPNNTTYHANLA